MVDMVAVVGKGDAGSIPTGTRPPSVMGSLRPKIRRTVSSCQTAMPAKRETVRIRISQGVVLWVVGRKQRRKEQWDLASG